MEKVLRLHQLRVNLFRHCWNRQPNNHWVHHRCTNQHSHSNSVRPTNSGLRSSSTHHWRPIPDWIFRPGRNIDQCWTDLTFIQRRSRSSVSVRRSSSNRNNSNNNISRIILHRHNQERSVHFTSGLIDQYRITNQSITITDGFWNELVWIFTDEAAARWPTATTSTEASSGTDSNTSPTIETFQRWRVPQQSDEHLPLTQQTSPYLFFPHMTVY